MVEIVRTRFKILEDIDKTNKPIKPSPVHYDAEGNRMTSLHDIDGTPRMTAIDVENVWRGYAENKGKYRSEKYLKKESRRLWRAKAAYRLSPLIEVGILAGIYVGTSYEAAAHSLGKIGLKHAVSADAPKSPVELFIGKDFEERQKHKIQGLMDTIASPFFVDPANLYPATTPLEKIRKNMEGSLNAPAPDQKGDTGYLGKVVLGEYSSHFNVIKNANGAVTYAYMDEVWQNGPLCVAKSLTFHRNANGDYSIQGFPENWLGATLKEIPFVDLSTDGTSTFPTDRPLDVVSNFVTEIFAKTSVLQPVKKKVKDHTSK